MPARGQTGGRPLSVPGGPGAAAAPTRLAITSLIPRAATAPSHSPAGEAGPSTGCFIFVPLKMKSNCFQQNTPFHKPKFYIWTSEQTKTLFSGIKPVS